MNILITSASQHCSSIWEFLHFTLHMLPPHRHLHCSIILLTDIFFFANRIFNIYWWNEVRVVYSCDSNSVCWLNMVIAMSTLMKLIQRTSLFCHAFYMLHDVINKVFFLFRKRICWHKSILSSLVETFFALSSCAFRI